MASLNLSALRLIYKFAERNSIRIEGDEEVAKTVACPPNYFFQMRSMFLVALTSLNGLRRLLL